MQVDLDSFVVLVTKALAKDPLRPLGDRIALHLTDLFLRHITQNGTACSASL